MQKRHPEGPLVEVIYRKDGVNATCRRGTSQWASFTLALSALLAGAPC